MNKIKKLLIFLSVLLVFSSIVLAVPKINFLEGGALVIGFR